MAIVTTILSTGRFNPSHERVVIGKSVLSGGDTAGDVVVQGLKRIHFFELTVGGGAEQNCSVNEAFPLATNAVSIVLEVINSTCFWKAKGLP